MTLCGKDCARPTDINGRLASSALAYPVSWYCFSSHHGVWSSVVIVSINHPLIHRINQSSPQSSYQSIIPSIIVSINHPFIHRINQSSSHSSYQSIIPSIIVSINHPLIHRINQSSPQSSYQSSPHSSYQSIILSFSAMATEEYFHLGRWIVDVCTNPCVAVPAGAY